MPVHVDKELWETIKDEMRQKYGCLKGHYREANLVYEIRGGRYTTRKPSYDWSVTPIFSSTVVN